MNSNKVCVLLSTYNGSKYIKEQIQSIICQSYEGEIIIFVRDDESDDNTVEILKTFVKEKYNNRKILIKQEKNIGPQKSFLWLINNAPDADIYFFSDQDDVWKTDKIKYSVEKIVNSRKKRVLFCSNYEVVDKNLRIINHSGIVINKLTFHFLRLVMFNTFPGCVMAFDYELLKVVKSLELENCIMHDIVVASAASALGSIIYDKKILISHRIHENNVVGYGFKKIHLASWLKNKFSLILNKEKYDLSEMAAKIISTGTDLNLKIKYIDDINTLVKFKRSLINTFRLLLHPDLRRKFDRCTISVYCKIFLHLF